MREWLVTNGLGSYASLTNSNENTRKFHGMLVASMQPPTKRRIFVSNVIDKIQIENKTYDLNNIKGDFEEKLKSYLEIMWDGDRFLRHACLGSPLT